MKTNRTFLEWVPENVKTNLLCIAIALSVYTINTVFIKDMLTGEIGYFCKCYLNDLICPLLFLGISQLLLIWAEAEIVKTRHIVVLGIVAGLVWEFFAPVINSQAVTDMVDMVCYAVGTIGYLFIHKLCRT